MQTNCIRRAIGAACCLSPVILLTFSLVAAMGDEPQKAFAFIWLALGSLLIALLNFFLSFVRPWLLAKRHGSLDGFRNVSGFPMVGTILAVLAGLLGFGASWTSIVGMVAMVLDTGGSLWFLAATWHDRSLWDGESPA